MAINYAIFKILENHYKAVEERFPKTNILGVFLYGSQNYNVDTENSDVDSIAIIVPTFEDVVLRQPISEEIHFENGEHCVVKDIREMVKMWKKQNINFLEVLYTDYFIMTGYYVNIWKEVLDIREEITHMDINKAIDSISGQAKHTFYQGKNECCKKMANALRLYHFLVNLIEGKPYKECLTACCDTIRAIKQQEAVFESYDLVEKLDKIKKDYKGTFLYNEEAETKLNAWLVKLLQKESYV